MPTRPPFWFWRKARDVRQELLANWLYGVAYRTALNAKKRRALRQVALASNSEGLLEGGVTCRTDAKMDQELHAVVTDEVHRLPATYRAPMVICYLEGKTNAEAAGVLRCQISAVRMRLLRGRELLRKRLGHRGVAMSVGTLAAFLAQESQAGVVPAGLFAGASSTAGRLAGNGTPIPSTIRELADATVRDEVSRRALLLWACGLATVGLTGGVLGTWLASNSGEKSKQASTTTGKSGTWQPVSNWEAAVHWQDPGLVFVEDRVLAWVSSNRNGYRGVRLRDLVTGSERSFPTDQQNVVTMALSPDGKTLATGSLDSTIKIWDWATGREKRTLRANAPVLPRPAFSPDGSMLACSCHKAWRTVWDLSSGAELWSNKIGLTASYGDSSSHVRSGQSNAPLLSYGSGLAVGPEERSAFGCHSSGMVCRVFSRWKNTRRCGPAGNQTLGHAHASSRPSSPGARRPAHATNIQSMPHASRRMVEPWRQWASKVWSILGT